MLVQVDIVLPCYKPGDKWPLELLNFYNEAGSIYNLSFIVVNDGTTDNKVLNQVDALKEKGVPVKLIGYEVNKGKGFALRCGIGQTSGNWVVYTDIDFPFTNKSMLDLMATLTQGNYDVIAGHRNQAYYQKKMSGFRILLSKAFRFFIKRILRISVSDTQCGLKGFNEKGREKFLTTKINRYLFDFEFIYTSCRAGNISVGTKEVLLKDNVIFSKMRTRVIVQELINLFYILLIKKS